MANSPEKLPTGNRASNIELLRILSMVMIIGFHIAIHSHFPRYAEVFTVNSLWLRFLRMGGKVGVNIFVLISGYFMVTGSSPNYTKAARLWLQVFTYSILCLLVALAFGSETFSILSVVKNLLPILRTKWWFATTYFLLFLLAPYLNKGLQALDENMHRWLLIILFAVWSVIPTFLPVNLECNNLLWFVFLYALAAYLRLHFDPSRLKTKTCLLFTLLVAVASYLIFLGLAWLDTKITLPDNYTSEFFTMEKLPVLLMSLGLFLGFLNLKMKSSPIINHLASATFGIYLIHDNSYIRKLLWQDLFRNAQWLENDLLIPYTLLQILLVFAVCAGIELLRIHLLERLYLPHLSRFFDWLKKLFKKKA